MGKRVLSVDPGRDKCGLAVVDLHQGVMARGVIPTSAVAAQAAQWMAAFRPSLIVMGNGTAMKPVRHALAELQLPVELVEEAHTTERARKRYFEENPPRGLRRLFLSMLTPPVPVDDLAAILIAEDYFAGEAIAEPAAEAEYAPAARLRVGRG